MDIQSLLDTSMQGHDHLCPRQILGVRIGLAGMKALRFFEPPRKKELLVISESDGCFVDGVTAATGCTVGHRTLRIEDYGKVAATFVEIRTGRAIRIAPVLDIRQRAYQYALGESRHYFAQMQAYQIMPDDVMFSLVEVRLATSVEELVSRPGVRKNCAMCGEEIINERQVIHQGLILCHACAMPAYYQTAIAIYVDNKICIE